ncbi:hypothetical protein AB0F24_17195 [Streptomyces platensis]|uniref:aggregation-promoting factor C-terminal-like domain-containing protein n=1 Tax=Streptomyces platensis TaxID=58346 RepID=UPI0033E93B5F
MAISVGSVEVDVVPNTRGIHRRLTQALVPAAEAAGEIAGAAAGERFGPAMSEAVSDGVGEQVGQRIGQQIASRITTSVRDALQNGVAQGGAQARAAATRQGEQTGSAFARSLQARLEAAVRNLPEIRLTANSSDAEREIYRLRHELQAISDLRIGIDISSADATAAIDRIRARLAELSASDADVALRVDSAAAVAELAAIQAQVDALDGDTARVDVDTSGAMAAILQLAIAIGGVAAIPAIPVLAAGIGSIAAAGLAAGAGVGALAAVAIPAFTGIKGALDAQKQAQDAATSATASGGQAASQAASKALQMAGAQQALASAHRNAARQIAQAEQGISDAVRTAAQNNTAASEQVKQARKSLADAYQQAADRTQSANDQVAQAEQSLSDAQRTARQAQQDLTQARHEAAVQLEELSTRITDAQLSERDAALGVQEARQRLLATQAVGSKATLLEQQRAQLGYDQAVQRLKEQQAEAKHLTAQKAEADRAGVEGSDVVRSAEERLATARRQVSGQQAGLAKAQQAAARTQIQNQQAIAAAQDKVAAAQRNVAKVQEDGARSVARAQQQLVATQQSAADSITSAQRQIQSAQLSTVGGANTASAAQAKYAAALAKLSPSARQTMAAFTSLKSAFTSWSTSLQPAVMPIFTRALNDLRAALPALTPIVLAAVGAIKRLQDRVSAGFKSPWWKSLQADLTGAVGPAITGLGVSFGNVFKGMAGVVDAFLPHMDGISSRMQSITKVFADWGTSLKGSPAFEAFLRYAAEMGPRVADVVGKIFTAAGGIGQALLPLSGPLLAALGAVAEAIGIIATQAPWMIQLIYGIIVAVKLWTLAQIAFNFVLNQNPLVRIAMLIGLLVAAVIYAYNRFGWFRAVVQAVWAGIQTAAMWAWNNVLKPIFSAFATAFHAIATAATWLWQNVLSPVFSFISAAARILFTVLVVAVFAPIILAVKAVGAIASWLWTNAIKPAFEGIAWLARWLWNNAIKPAFELLKAGVRAVGAVARWLWQNVIKPAFNGIGAVIGWVWRNIVSPIFASLKMAVKGLGAIFSWLWKTIIRPVFGWIGDRIGWVWKNLIKPPFDAIKRAVGLVGDAFGAAKNAIKKSWDQVVNVTKKPVNFVIKWVYTNGIKALWDKVAGWVGLGKLPAAPKLLAAGGTVGNGFGPARPMVTNRPTAIVGEGNSCIARGVLIETTSGPLPIENVSPGHEVLTRGGYRLVIWSGLTRPDAEVLLVTTSTGDRVTCTPDHRIWSASGGTHGGRGGDRLGGRTLRRRGVLPGDDSEVRESCLCDVTTDDGSRRRAKVPGHRELRPGPRPDESGGESEADLLAGSVREGNRGAVDNRVSAMAGRTSGREGSRTPGGHCGTECSSETPGGLLQAGTPVVSGECIHEPAGRPGLQDLQAGSRPRMDAPEAGWVEARELVVGDWVWVLDPDQKLSAAQVASVEAAERIDTFDLSVQDDHEFVAGGILVHNSYPEYVIPTDPKYRNRALALHAAAGTRLMADGGILGDIWGGIKSAGGWVADKATGALKAAGRFAAGALAPAFNLGLKAINGTLSRIPGADTGLGKVVRAIPNKVADGILSFLRGEDEKSMGGANVAKALTWAKSQAGKPYQWGGAGNPSWDCSGFMSGIQKVIEGRNPKGRLWSTFSFQGSKAPAGWKYHLKSPFQIGVTNNGKGHTAGTLAGTNVESRGGDGVIVGSRARGYNDSLFHNNWYGLVSALAGASGGAGGAKSAARQMLGEFGWSQKQWPALDKLWTRESGWRWNAANPSGAYGIPQALPGSKMKSAGADWRTNPATQIKWGLKYIKGRYGSPSAAWAHSQDVNWYDSGGYLAPGLNLAYNGTGRPEPVFTSQQANALVSLAGSGGAGGPAKFEGDLYLDSGEFLGRVRGEATQIAQVEVRRSNTALAGVLRAGRRG